MKMHNPPHPGEFLKETYLTSSNVSYEETAQKLGITLTELCNFTSAQVTLSPELARKLQSEFKWPAESWLLMQDTYNQFNFK